MKGRDIKNYLISSFVFFLIMISVLFFWDHEVSYYISFIFLIIIVIYGLGLVTRGLTIGFGNGCEGIAAIFFLLSVITIAQVFFGRIYVALEVFDDKQELNGMWDSIYFSVTTWTTLGYGDFTPRGTARIVTSIQAMLGYIFMALSVATFVNALKK